MKLSSFFLALILLSSHPIGYATYECDSSVQRSLSSSSTIVCPPLGSSSTPNLDGDLSDWTSFPANRLSLTSTLSLLPYSSGDVSIKCTFDSTHIYMAFEIPGPYRFSTTDDHLCASISTMWKVGPESKFINMGGCPHVVSGKKCDGVPEKCHSYRVDLGGHWELKTTKMGIKYGADLHSGSGNDLIANKDDEWGVSPYCRPDDNDGLAANEWAGAWVHTNLNTTDARNRDGSYIFEMSRALKTASDLSDVQLEEGRTYDFGFAFWDPYERDVEGWSKSGHYVTGCAKDWVPLKLGNEITERISSSKAIGNKAYMTSMVALVTFIAFVGEVPFLSFF